MDDTDSMRPVRLYAHRGGTEHAPENSWAAFESAHRMGIRYLETDARATWDGVCLAHHDATMDRTTDIVGRVSDLSWTEVSRAHMPGGHPVLRLDDLLGSLRECHVNIDLKDARSLAPALDAITRTDAWSRVTLTSFSTTRLRAARRRIPPGTETSATPREVLAVLLASRRPRRPPKVVGQRLQVPDRLGGRIVLTPDFIRTAHALGRPVDAWTVNDPDAVERLLDWGVDGIMTDRPGVVLELMRSRGVPLALPGHGPGH